MKINRRTIGKLAHGTIIEHSDGCFLEVDHVTADKVCAYKLSSYDEETKVRAVTDEYAFYDYSDLMGDRIL